MFSILINKTKDYQDLEIVRSSFVETGNISRLPFCV